MQTYNSFDALVAGTATSPLVADMRAFNADTEWKPLSETNPLLQKRGSITPDEKKKRDERDRAAKVVQPDWEKIRKLAKK